MAGFKAPHRGKTSVIECFPNKIRKCRRNRAAVLVIVNEVSKLESI